MYTAKNFVLNNFNEDITITSLLSSQSLINDDRDNILYNTKLTLDKQTHSKIRNLQLVYTFTNDHENRCSNSSISFNNRNIKNIDISKIVKSASKSSVAEQMSKEYYEENSKLEYLEKNIFTGDNSPSKNSFNNVDVSEYIYYLNRNISRRLSIISCLLLVLLHLIIIFKKNFI